MTWLINLRKGVKEDEKNLKNNECIFGFPTCCGMWNIPQQLAGEYETYTENARVYESIILEEPKSRDGTSGNASYDLHDSSHNIYYGTYKVYEKI